MAQPARKPATYADLEALPANMRGEILEGVMYAFPRPRARHQRVISCVDGSMHGPYDRGHDGPGGWWILTEPGIELPGSPEVSPDLAGWKRSRMPSYPPAEESIRVVPDWVCEVLSPSTRRYDLRVKKPFYARIGVSHLWIIDPEERSLTALQLNDGKWLELGIWGDDEIVKVAPFEAVGLELAEMWAGDPAPPTETGTDEG